MSDPQYQEVLIEDVAGLAALRKKAIVIVVTYDDAYGRSQVVTWGREPGQKLVGAVTGERVAWLLGRSQEFQVSKDFRSAMEAAENKAEVDRLRAENAELRRLLADQTGGAS